MLLYYVTSPIQLMHFYSAQDNGSMYAMYNDQITTPMNNYHKSRLEKGHTKGIDITPSITTTIINIIKWVIPMVSTPSYG